MADSQKLPPYLGVHVLSEFLYCERAGIVAHTQRTDDPGEEEPPSLGYLPDFDIALIEADLRKVTEHVRVASFVLSVVLVIAALVICFVDWLACLFVLPLYLPVRWFLQQCRIAAELRRRRNAANAAGADRPPLPLSRQCSINLWSLLKSGFELLHYSDQHTDDHLRLSGHPWRVLREGSLLIPVFRKRYGDVTVRPQHIVRMAAYCHLLESTELADSPYGIILFGNGPDGVAIPITPQAKHDLEQALERSQRLLAAHQVEGLSPKAPNGQVCLNCPLGEPAEYHVDDQAGVLNSQTSSYPVLSPRNNRLYHCPCGDVFEWIPPHRRAARRGLS